MTALKVIDKHHLIPKARLRRGYTFHRRYSRIRLKRYKHNAWHVLFGHKTIDEVIALLERVRRAKTKGGNHD